MGLPISQLTCCPVAHVESQEQPSETVPNREPPKGSSLMGTKPSDQVAIPPIPKHMNVRASGKSPAKKRGASTEKQMSTVMHSPLPDPALMPHILASILHIWAPLPRSSEDGPKAPSSTSPMWHISCIMLAERRLREIPNIPSLCIPSIREPPASSPQCDMGLGAAALARIPAVSLPKWLPLMFIIRKT